MANGASTAVLRRRLVLAGFFATCVSLIPNQASAAPKRAKKPCMATKRGGGCGPRLSGSGSSDPGENDRNRRDQCFANCTSNAPPRTQNEHNFCVKACNF